MRPTVSGKPDTHNHKFTNKSQVKTKSSNSDTLLEKREFASNFLQANSNNINNNIEEKEFAIFTEYSKMRKVGRGFSITVEADMVYQRPSRYERQLLNELISKLIVEFGKRRKELTGRPQIIINMPISIAVSKSESKSEASDSVLLKRLRSLRAKLREYESQINEYEREISKLKSELRRKEQQIKELERRLTELRPDTVRAKAELEIIRKVKGTLINLVKSGVLTKEQLNLIYKALGW